MTTVADIMKARSTFKRTLDRYGIQQSKLARAANVGASTVQSMARPQFFGRDATTRATTAHKIAAGFAQLTGMSQDEALALLFEEE
jgi:hypothetical protein